VKESTNKEKMLKNIRDALIDKSENKYQNIDFDSSVYTDITDTLDIVFAENFTNNSGKFIYCTDLNEFIKNLDLIAVSNRWDSIYCSDYHLLKSVEALKTPIIRDINQIETIKIGLTRCEFLIARHGSIMVSSKQLSGRKMNVLPEIHFVMAFTSQLVADIKQAIIQIRAKYNSLPSMISIISGPSRTADIEKNLVMGAHGPKELYLFMIDDTY
jgi:L-lactate dehydrogenase complex protein LldG